MGSSRTNPNAARKAFVKAAGIFGKYAYRSMSYVGENMVAFIGLTATIATLFLISSAFGVTIPVIVATAESAVATLAGMPLLGATVALAAAIAAPETLKKIYKECTEWVVGAYQNVVRNWFMPNDFTVSVEKAQQKKEKHPPSENESDQEYSQRLTNLRAKKYSKIYDSKTAALDLAGKSGQKTFKKAANGLADGFEWVVGAPAYLYSCLPSFSSSRANSSSLTEPLMKDEMDTGPAAANSPSRHRANSH